MTSETAQLCQQNSKQLVNTHEDVSFSKLADSSLLGFGNSDDVGLLRFAAS
ncbi:MAG: hypothetical protein JWM68_3612 [Verrucomicrobiales bacterium]|nr:hypothetical protein [Verrucomicrobiales bacterium]